MNALAATTVVILLLILGGWFGYMLGSARQEAYDMGIINEINTDCLTMIPPKKTNRARKVTRRRQVERAH